MTNRTFSDRQSIADVLALDIHASEEASATAILEMAQLTVRMIESRRTAGVSATVGVPILQELHSAHGCHLQALDHAARAHKKVEALGRAMRITATGPTDKEDNFVPANPDTMAGLTAARPSTVD